MKRACALPVLAVLLLSAAPALAQGGAMVQATPPAMAVERLNDNLTRLSRSPTDMDALLGAGMAAYELGDAQAANGFFMRADMVNPRIGRAKLGLALVELQLKQFRESAANFDAAAQLGEPAGAYLAERALAYDLVGEQGKAQRDYAAALKAKPGDPDIIRNYAVSLGISGRVADAEALIRPLLVDSDRAAWRNRAMILAMNGRTAEARRIAQTVMPRTLADQMDPYLVRMAGLTPAQKAAATHFGQFPADGLRLAPVTLPPPVQLAEKDNRRRKKGRDEDKAAPAALQDDSRLAAAMPRADAPAAAPPAAMVQPVPVAPPPARPAPVALASRDNSADDDPDAWIGAERSIRRQAQPARRSAASAPAAPTAPPAMAQPIPAASASRGVMGPPAPGTPVPMPVPMPVPVPVPARAPQPPAPPPSPAPSSATTEEPRSLAAIMADIKVPEAERQASAPAVDLAEIARLQAQRRKAEAEAAAKAAAEKAKKAAEAKAKAEAAAKAKAEAEEKARIKANPARYWVQVATGRDPAALAFDLRRLRKTYGALDGLDGWTAEWGATRRLLVGPFSTAAKAKVVESDLRKAGSDSFIWQSDAGEVVETLSRK